MSTAVATSLLEKLKEIQTREGLKGNAFARKLGISPQLYHMTKDGKRDVGLEVLKAIAKAYPELDRDVLLFLRGDVHIKTAGGDVLTTPYQTTQDGKLGRFRGRVISIFALVVGYFKKSKINSHKP